MPFYRLSCRLFAPVAVLVSSGVGAWGQSLPATIDLAPPPPAASAPAAAPREVAPPTAVPAAPTINSGIATSPFVGVVKGDRVYVRSGAGSTFYPIGQVLKGDMVDVVAAKNGWYQISPPIGTTGYVAKNLVDPSTDQKTATVKANTVNVRAASLLFPTSDYAVIGQVHKGDALTIVGVTEKYYKISPPSGVYVYISTSLVKPADAGTIYAAPSLHLPAGTATTGSDAAPNPASPTLEITGNTTQPSGEAPAPSTESGNVVVLPQPASGASRDAWNAYDDVNKRLQAEMNKPVGQRDYKAFLKEFQDLAAKPDLPKTVQLATQSRLDSLQKFVQIQDLAGANSVAEEQQLNEKTHAYEQQWQDSQKKIATFQENQDYLAKGILRRSNALTDRYVLVDPSTQRTVAYLDPVGEVNFSKLLGEYVGVKGTETQESGSEVKVITVKTAAMIKAPE